MKFYSGGTMGFLLLKGLLITVLTGTSSQESTVVTTGSSVVSTPSEISTSPVRPSSDKTSHGPESTVVSTEVTTQGTTQNTGGSTGTVTGDATPEATGDTTQGLTSSSNPLVTSTAGDVTTGPHHSTVTITESTASTLSPPTSLTTSDALESTTRSPTTTPRSSAPPTQHSSPQGSTGKTSTSEEPLQTTEATCPPPVPPDTGCSCVAAIITSIIVTLVVVLLVEGIAYCIWSRRQTSTPASTNMSGPEDALPLDGGRLVFSASENDLSDPLPQTALSRGTFPPFYDNAALGLDLRLQNSRESNPYHEISNHGNSVGYEPLGRGALEPEHSYTTFKPVPAPRIAKQGGEGPSGNDDRDDVSQQSSQSASKTGLPDIDSNAREESIPFPSAGQEHAYDYQNKPSVKPKTWKSREIPSKDEWHIPKATPTGNRDSQSGLPGNPSPQLGNPPRNPRDSNPQEVRGNDLHEDTIKLSSDQMAQDRPPVSPRKSDHPIYHNQAFQQVSRELGNLYAGRRAKQDGSDKGGESPDYLDLINDAHPLENYVELSDGEEIV